MIQRIAALLITCVTMDLAPDCLAQAQDDFPDSTLTIEQWEQRLQDARRRSEEFVTNARTRASDPPSADKEDAEAADQRVMNDPSLRRGDVITTSKGFFVFNGRVGEEHHPADFLPARNPRDPTQHRP